MLKVSELTGLKIFVPKKPKTAKDGTATERVSRLGRVHMAVFSPGGRKLVGFTVKRPDVVGMVKRGDAFLAWDSFVLEGKELRVTDTVTGLDDKAIRRLGLDWDRCIMWAGMDAKTVDGKPLGYVSDAEFDEKTGRVARFLTTDGGMARALIGSFQIEPEMVRGYSDGFMIVDTQGKAVQLDGGLAGAAGESYARAKASAAEMGKKAGEAAGKAVDKGSFALGRMLGKAKRAIAEAAEPEEEPVEQAPAVAAADVRVSEPVVTLPATEADREERPEPKTYAPAAKAAHKTAAKAAPKTASSQPKAAAKRPAAKKPSSTSEKAARAAGKQLGSFGKMFGSFADEFKKASK